MAFKVLFSVIAVGIISYYGYVEYSKEVNENKQLNQEIAKQVKGGKNTSFQVKRIISIRRPTFEETKNMTGYFQNSDVNKKYFAILEASVSNGDEDFFTVIYAQASDFKRIESIKRLEGIKIDDSGSELGIIANVTI